MKRDHAGLHSTQCSELNWGSMNRSCIKCSLQAVANPSSLVKLNNLIFLVPWDGPHFNLGYCFCFFFFSLSWGRSQKSSLCLKKNVIVSSFFPSWGFYTCEAEWETINFFPPQKFSFTAKEVQLLKPGISVLLKWEKLKIFLFTVT